MTEKDIEHLVLQIKWLTEIAQEYGENRSIGNVIQNLESRIDNYKKMKGIK